MLNSKGKKCNPAVGQLGHISFAIPQENEQAKAGIGADCFFVKSTKAA